MYNVSCIVRTKNSSNTIKKCLDSIVLQEVQDLQIIIVDSGSSDDTLRIASTYPNLKIIPYPKDIKFNYSKALNIGIEQADSKYILNFSSHCSFKSNDSLKQMIHDLDRFHNCCAISIHPYDKMKYNEAFYKTPVIYEKYNYENFKWLAMSNSCSLIRKEDWQKFPFSEKIRSCEDQHWAYHFFKKYNNYSLFLKNHFINYENRNYNLDKEVTDTISIITQIWENDSERKKYIKNEIRSIFKNLFRLKFNKMKKSILICMRYWNKNSRT